MTSHADTKSTGAACRTPVTCWSRVDTSLGADKADILSRVRALADRVARLEGGRA